jgi:cation:H+ antiporter
MESLSNSGGIMIQLLIIVGTCIWIAKACNPFEESADYLGRNMRSGIKGATINAVASSLPELFTTMSFLFIYNDTAGFASGVATTAGSAVFNIAVIPAVVILAVVLKLKKTGIKIDKNTIVRDGVFYIISIIALILILNQTSISVLSGVALLLIYACYVIVLVSMNRMSTEEDEPEDSTESNNHNVFVNILRFDFRNAFNPYGIMTTTGAWIGLILSVVHVAVACHLLAGAVVNLAGSWGMSTFFVAVVLASAATSVPDTIMSLKDGLKGNYDDAISNAVGSNIFDICVSLGLPLTLYTIFNGSVSLGSEGQNVIELLIMLVIITVTVLCFFLIPKRIKIHAAVTFTLIYGAYIFYALSRGAEVPWAMKVSTYLNTIF